MRGPHVGGSSGAHTQGRRLAGRASQRSGWADELGCGEAGLKLQAVVGCARERKLGCGASGLKRRKREGSKRKGFSFFKHTQTMNSNSCLNSNTQK
jgi:hypothetical protein